MKPVRLLIISALALATCWIASEWWQKAWATQIVVEQSPDGCLRLEQYRPFWLLPSWLHAQRHPDPEVATDPFLFAPWESPSFFRLYDVRTGEVLAETDVYDAADLYPVVWGARVGVGVLEVADVSQHACRIAATTGASK